MLRRRVTPPALRVLVVAALLSLAGARLAHADPRGRAHPDVQAEGTARRVVSFSASAAAVAGMLDVAGKAGWFQGVLAVGAVHYRRFDLSLGMSAYHMNLPDREPESAGGDFMARLATRLLATRRVSLGATLGASFPSGTPSAGTGMGHAMVMAGSTARVAALGMRWDTFVGYGQALARSADPDGGGVGTSLVRPMNPREIQIGERVSTRFGAFDSIGLGASLAVPVGEGDPRLSSAIFATRQLGDYQVGGSLEVGLLGTPQRLVIGLTIGRHF